MVFLLTMITQKEKVDGVTDIIQSGGTKYNSQKWGDLIDSCILVLSRKFEQISKGVSGFEPDIPGRLVSPANWSKKSFRPP